jgi:hypothetical protein
MRLHVGSVFAVIAMNVNICAVLVVELEDEP